MTVQPAGDLAAILDDPWMTSRQVAAYAGCSVVTVHRAALSGDLESEQAAPNCTRKYKKSYVDRWVTRKAAR